MYHTNLGVNPVVPNKCIRKSSCTTGGAHIDMTETQSMIRDLKSWRRKAASELGVDIRIVERRVSAILFGMRLQKWKHLKSISNEKRSVSVEKVERCQGSKSHCR